MIVAPSSKLLVSFLDVPQPLTITAEPNPLLSAVFLCQAKRLRFPEAVAYLGKLGAPPSPPAKDG